MHIARLALAAVLAATAVPAAATVFTFADPPFAGSDALTTPGRQIVGNELFIPNFDVASDVLALNGNVFGTGPTLGFVSAPAAALPSGGVNFVVLRDFDADNDPGNGVLMNAGLAANLIADAIVDAGPGFFLYFNSGLDLPRLVFSTDLSSSTADLKILARFTNLTGEGGRQAFAAISQANIAAVPEPDSWALLIAGFGLVGAVARRRRGGRCAASA